MQTARYYYTEAGAQNPQGPVSLEELRALANKGAVTADTHVIREGDDQWLQFRRLEKTESNDPVSSGVILHPDWKPPPLESQIAGDDQEAEEESTSLGSLLFPIVVTALAILAIVAAVNWRKLSREVVRTVSRPMERATPAPAAPNIQSAPQLSATAAPAPTIAAAPQVMASAAPQVPPPPAQKAPPEPWLGLRVQNLNANENYQKVYKGIDRGVVVQMIEPASLAAESKLWSADVITHFDGIPVAGEEDAQHEVFKRKPGDTIELTVVRNKHTLKIPVKVSERSRSFAGTWDGTDHHFKFADQTGNSEYRQADNSPVEVEISDDESHVTTRNPNNPPTPQASLPNNVPDWWYHQDARTLAWATDPQYQIDLLGDGNTALLKRTPYKDQIDAGGPVLKGFLTTSRALLRKTSDSNIGGMRNVIDLKLEGQPKAEATLSSNQTVPGELVLLRITLGGTAQFTLPEQIAVDGLEIEPCGIASPKIDSGVEKASGTVYEYAILPLRAGRFTIPSQTISTRDQSFQTAAVELSVRSGRPELPTFKEWLNRDTFGNLLPPTNRIPPATYDGPTEPMTYKRFGHQRLTRLTVGPPFRFSVIVPTDIFPDAVSVLSKGNIEMAPGKTWAHLIYLPVRPVSSFESTYRSLAADASQREPLKVTHLRVLRDNSFVVQSGTGQQGFYMAGFRRRDGFYMMEIGYDENNCAFTAETLKAMSDSFLANGPR